MTTNDGCNIKIFTNKTGDIEDIETRINSWFRSKTRIRIIAIEQSESMVNVNGKAEWSITKSYHYCLVDGRGKDI